MLSENCLPDEQIVYSTHCLQLVLLARAAAVTFPWCVSADSSALHWLSGMTARQWGIYGERVAWGDLPRMKFNIHLGFLSLDITKTPLWAAWLCLPFERWHARLQQFLSVSTHPLPPDWVKTRQKQSKDHLDAVRAMLGAVTSDPSQGFSMLQHQTQQLVFGGTFPLHRDGEGDHLDTAACCCWL